MDECHCDECGCTGNHSCGCESANSTNSCELDNFLCCPCCNILGTEANKSRWPENNIAPDAEQIEMVF